MTRAVRIRQHLYDEIARRAASERRSIIGQLEYLLEQALRLQDSSGAGHGAQGDPATGPGRTGMKQPVPDSHFKPDPK